MTSAVSGTIAGTVQFESGGDPVGSPQTVSSAARRPSRPPRCLSAIPTCSPRSSRPPRRELRHVDQHPVWYTVKALNATATLCPASDRPGDLRDLGDAQCHRHLHGPGTISGTVQFESGERPVGSPQTVTPAPPRWRPPSCRSALPTRSRRSTADGGNTFATSTSTSVKYTVHPADNHYLAARLRPPGIRRYFGDAPCHRDLGCVRDHHRHGAVRERDDHIGSPQTVSSGAASLATTQFRSAVPTRSPRFSRRR